MIIGITQERFMDNTEHTIDDKILAYDANTHWINEAICNFH